MKWSYRIARVAGTEVKLHITFLGILALYGYAVFVRRGPGAALATVLFLFAIFFCVLLHEFGHIAMARRFGIRTPDVILLPIGGVARLERMPEKPRQELLVALAGPAVTLAIAGLLYALLAARGTPPTLAGTDLAADGGGASALAQLCLLNVYLLLFNLVPAFPMDGGRVLRALLALRLGYARATRVAASVGQLLAFVMAFVALVTQSWMLVFIAFFVFLGAGSEASAVEERAIGHGIRAAQMMVTQFRTLPVYASLADAVDLLLAGEQREFPVIDNLGHVEGILTRDHLIRGLSQRGPSGAVQEVMQAHPPLVSSEASFDEALAGLRASGLPALPVIDADGRLVGLLTSDNITDLLLVRRAVAK